MRDQLFHLSPESGGSLQSQVREMMVRAILDRHIPGGSAVPSCRQLAQQLGVARNTVVLAYQRLVDEGYLLSKERSGYYVNDDILGGRVEAVDEPESGDIVGPEWDQRLKAVPSHQRNIVKPSDWQSYPYPFIYGQFDLALFPLSEWRECSRRALTVGAVKSWASDSIDSDDASLIEQLHTRVLPRRGVWAAPDEILITVGAQHAIYLVAALLLDRDSVVGIENPGYPDARNIFLMRTPSVVGLPVDDEGLVLEGELKRCDYLYTTPSHQHPTTVTLSLARREKLLARAVNDDFIIIEDDYESETNYVGQPTPALKSLDHSDRVIYIGSLSKTLAPGLRLGYMVGPSELIREARALRRLMLRHPPANNQRAVALFLSLGHHDSLVRRLSHAYKDRWRTVGNALARYLPESSQMPAFGGTAYWVKGPDGLDVRRLEKATAEKGILIEPGEIFFLNEPRPRNYFRLGFSSIPVERIEPGIRQLADLVHALA